MFRRKIFFGGIIAAIILVSIVIFIKKGQSEIPIIDASYRSPEINYFEDILHTYLSCQKTISRCLNYKNTSDKHICQNTLYDISWCKNYMENINIAKPKEFVTGGLDNSPYVVAKLDLKDSDLNKNKQFLYYGLAEDPVNREKWYKEFSEQEFKYDDLYLKSGYEKYYLGDYKYALDDLNMYIKKYPNSYKGYIAKALLLETIYVFDLSNTNTKISKKNISSKIENWEIKDLNALKKFNKEITATLNKERSTDQNYKGLSEDSFRTISKTQIIDLDIFIEDPILSEILSNYYKALEILSTLGKIGYLQSDIKVIQVSEGKGQLNLNKDIVIKDFYSEEETFCLISIKLLLDKIAQNIIVKDIIGKDIPYFYELSYNDSFLDKQIQVSENKKNKFELSDFQNYKESARAKCFIKNLNQTFYKIGIKNAGYQTIIKLLSSKLDNSNVDRHIGILNAISENVYSKILIMDKLENNFDIYDRLQKSNPYFAPYYIQNLKNLNLSKKDKKLICQKAIFVAADKEYINKICNKSTDQNDEINLKDYIVTQTKVQPVHLKLHIEWHPEYRTVAEQIRYTGDK